jgi:hypothetical protein
MIALTQFVVVRRDLPTIRKIIDVGHAAGEAFYIFAMLKLAPEGFDPNRTTLLVKGARNEKKLLKLEKKLISKGVYHLAVREPMAPWNGQLMAIGLVPGDREIMGYHLSDFEMLKLTDESSND